MGNILFYINLLLATISNSIDGEVIRDSSIYSKFTPNFKAFPEKILSLADRNQKQSPA
jgi:hypothetical protein